MKFYLYLVSIKGLSNNFVYDFIVLKVEDFIKIASESFLIYLKTYYKLLNVLKIHPILVCVEAKYNIFNNP